jgi:hypothetical protein
MLARWQVVMEMQVVMDEMQVLVCALARVVTRLWLLVDRSLCVAIAVR